MERNDHDDAISLVDDGLMTIRQAGEWLQLSRSRLYELMDDGSLPSVRIGRSRRIPRIALVNLAERGLHGGVPIRTSVSGGLK